MKIWINTADASWGTEPDNLVIVDLVEVQKQFPGLTQQDILNSLDLYSDSYIADFGIKHGKRVTESNR